MSLLPNPTDNPPRLPAPGQSRAQFRPASRSPSLSPVRRTRNLPPTSDYLLRDLSPTSTLRAFTTNSDIINGEHDSRLARSVETASSSERAFGVTVAQTYKDLRSWTIELSGWEWPGTFDPPPMRARATTRKRLLSERFSNLGLSSPILYAEAPPELDGGFWGSLPKEIVEHCESRIDEITDAVEELDVEGLKGRVRDVHNQPRYNHGPQQTEQMSTRLSKLDDFTTLVTATIMQALSQLSRLNRLLDAWIVRLTVLRKVPGYLRETQDVKTTLDHAWEYASHNPHVHQHPDSGSVSGLARADYESTRKLIGTQLSALGQRLDSMLDDLEGRPETIPEHWIDTFENLESTYGDWVVDTDRKVMEIEWQQSRKGSPELNSSVPLGHTHPHDALGISTESISEPSRDVSPLKGPVSPLESEAHDPRAVVSRPDQKPFRAAQHEPESPILGNESSTFWTPEEAVPDFHGTQQTEKEAPETQESELIDDVIAESQDQSQLPSGNNLDDALGQSWLENDSGTALHAVLLSAEIASPSPTHSTSSARNRVRHIPIDIHPYEDAAISADTVKLPPKAQAELIELPGDIPELVQHNVTPALPQEFQSPAAESIATRTSRLKAELERSQSLNKTKSPVRPFEHASQAFTKLFSRSNSQRHSRSSSNGSRTSNVGHRVAIPTGSGSDNTGSASNRASDQSLGTGPTTAGSQSSTSGPSSERISNNAPGTGDTNSANSRTMSRSQSIILSEMSHQPDSHGKEMPGQDIRRFDSPFMAQRLSDQWPVPVTRRPADEITSPEKAIKSDFFERMFVDSLPLSPPREDIVPAKFTDARRTELPYNNSANGSDKPVQQHHIVEHDYFARPKDEHISSGKVRSAAPTSHPGLPQESLPSGAVASISEVTTPGSFKSTLSTPEIRDASAAGYFRPMTVHTPPALTRYPSNSTARQKSIRSRPNSSEHAEPLPRLRIPSKESESASYSEEEENNQARPERINMAKRASVASIEHFARSELRTIEVQRTPSISSVNSTTPTTRSPPHARLIRGGVPLPLPTRSEPNSPIKGKQLLEPPPSRSMSAREAAGLPWMMRTDTERSMIGQDLGASKPPPLDFQVMKRRQPAHLTDHDVDSADSPDSGYIADMPVPPTKSPKRRQSLPQEKGDTMDRHVSNVLQNLPAAIRFTSIPSQGRPRRPSTSTADKGRHSPAAATGSDLSAGLTLAPASATAMASRKYATEPDVKLYHLSQPGNDPPIKLFVRLVGDKERVMVRVGGGWADLGEYLRQYAEHHGRRMGSGSQIEVQEASAGSMRAKTGKRRKPVSRPGSVMDKQRPDSAAGTRRSSGATSSPQFANGWPMPDAMMATPNGMATNADATPKSASSKSSSRPSTAGASRPDSRQSWTGDEIGLAGTAGKKKSRDSQLDQAKAKWVEDMIDRAKKASSASAEKSRGDDKVWADMGGSGRTKRVLYKAGQE